MKTILFAGLILLAFTACRSNTQQPTAETIPENGVEVLSFYGKQRCQTCIAIEKATAEVIETQFSEQIKDGSLHLRSIDITQPEHKALADKYEITWSSLLLVRQQNGKEIVNNLTQSAFANAQSNPEKFKAELKAALEKLLKE